MVRTCIQITALSLVLMSSYFLVKGVICISAQDMIKLSQSTYGGTYMRIAKNLAQQKADTIVGFVLLLTSFFFSLINFLWPMQIDDSDVNRNGVILAGLVSIVIFPVSYKVCNVLQQYYYQGIENKLKANKKNN